MVVGGALLFVVTLVWLYFLWSRRKYYLAAYKIGGPWGLPFIGIAHKVCNLSDDRENNNTVNGARYHSVICLPEMHELNLVYMWFQQYGATCHTTSASMKQLVNEFKLLYDFPKYAEANNVKTYFTWIGTIPTLYTMDPKIVEVIVNSPACYNKPPLYNIIREALGDGLLTIKAPIWNKHRKLLNPCFGYKLLLTMFTKFNDSARALCDNFDKCVNQGEVHIKDYVFESALMSSIATTMGISFNSESDVQILKNFEVLLSLGTYRIFRPWLHSDAIWSLTTYFRPFTKALTTTKNMVLKLIETKIKALDGQNNNMKEAEEQTFGVGKTSHVFIDQAINIHQNKEFTLEDIVSHANLLVLAAYETSATALYSILLMLAIHPEIQDRLFNEISSLYPDKELNVTQEQLKSMVYLEMCINETLRLVPPVPMTARECSEDIPITKDISIPTGTQIALDIFNLHRNKDIWGPDALKFNPDNFLPANMEDKHSCSFIPFSKGPRNCIGWQYAGMWLKVMLPHLIRRFRFSTTARLEDLKFLEQISLKYVDPPAVEIHLRS